MRLSPAQKGWFDDLAWEYRGWIERMLHDCGLPREDAEAKRFASRMAVHRTLVEEGLLMEADP